jgi:hypothetical protein
MQCAPLSQRQKLNFEPLDAAHENPRHNDSDHGRRVGEGGWFIKNKP